MTAEELLRRDDPTGSIVSAYTNTRIAIEKVARSQTWEIEGAQPFPTEVLPLLQEANKLLARANTITREHAKAFVWPVHQRLVKERTLAETFAKVEP